MKKNNACRNKTHAVERVYERVLAVFCVLCLVSCNNQYEYTKEIPPPVVPTIFVFSRDQERPFIMIEEEERIVLAAKSYICNSDEWENIIIIDEGACWYVYFGLRGNGFVQPTNKGFQVPGAIVDGITAIYLNKEDLKIASIPEKNIETGLYIFSRRIDDLEWGAESAR